MIKKSLKITIAGAFTQTDRDRDRHTDTHRHTQTHTDRHRHRHRHRHTHTHTQRVFLNRETKLVLLLPSETILIPAFEICLATKQLRRLLLREICIYSNVCWQIIAEVKLP